jgi:hypothetical protein
MNMPRNISTLLSSYLRPFLNGKDLRKYKAKGTSIVVRAERNDVVRSKRSQAQNYKSNGYRAHKITSLIMKIHIKTATQEIMFTQQ